MKRRCGRVELYKKFHMNALEDLILWGKRYNLAEMRKMIHNGIDGDILTPMKDIHVVMKVFRAV